MVFQLSYSFRQNGVKGYPGSPIQAGCHSATCNLERNCQTLLHHARFLVNPLTLKIFFFCVLFSFYSCFVLSFVLLFSWCQIYRTVNVKGLNTPHAQLADLTVSKRPGTSNQIKIYFPVLKPLYLFFLYENC